MSKTERPTHLMQRRIENRVWALCQNRCGEEVWEQLGDRADKSDPYRVMDSVLNYVSTRVNEHKE